MSQQGRVCLTAEPPTCCLAVYRCEAMRVVGVAAATLGVGVGFRHVRTHTAPAGGLMMSRCRCDTHEADRAARRCT